MINIQGKRTVLHHNARKHVVNIKIQKGRSIVFTPQGRRQTVFQNEHVLRERTFAEPISRDEELKSIANAVRPLTRGVQSVNLFIHGPAGTGKTTCVEHVCKKLEEQTRVGTVSINCWKHNTRPSLLTQLLIELGYPAPRKGKPIDELLTKLREWLDKNKSIAVVLDEFDQLDQQNEVIYDLHELGVETDSTVGMILLSNKSPNQIELEPRSLSRLGYRVLVFEPYQQEDLEQILEHRAQEAFRRNAISEGVMDLIARVVTGGPLSGDCRRALDILYQAGREADRERSDTVSREHVNRVVDRIPF